MSSPIEAKENLRREQEALNSLQGMALLGFEELKRWLPALNTKTAGRGIIAGILGFMSVACSPKPEPTPTPQTPIVRAEPTPAAASPLPPEPPTAQKEVVQKKPGIYAKILTLEQTDAPVRNHLKYIQAPVSKVIDIEAVDSQNPNNVAGFGFVETTDNQPRFVFKTPDNNAISFQYTAAATIDKDGKVNVEYLTKQEEKTFLQFVLVKSIPKQTSETDMQYAERVTKLLSDISYQQEIQETLGKPEQIEQVTVTNPYANQKVVFDLKKEPNLLEQLLTAFSPKTAYAQSLPPRPTPALTEAPKAVQKPSEAPKPLPEVINSQTVEFVSPPAEEVQKAVEEAKAKGEIKIPLPDIVKSEGISVVEIITRRGEQLFAITSNKEGEYRLPSLSDGKILIMAVSKATNVSALFIVRPDNKSSWGYAFPSLATSLVKQGDTVKIGQPIVSFTYNPGGIQGQAFIRYLESRYANAPKNTIALISLGDGAGRGINLSKGNVLTTLQGSIVITGSP